MAERRKLTGGERAILLLLIGAHPAASCGQIRLMFRARAGREITRGAVWLAQTRGYRPAGGPGLDLGPADRELLFHLILEAAPGYFRAEVARQFLAATGRAISASTVSRHVLALGLPRRGPGRPRRPAGPAGRSVKITC